MSLLEQIESVMPGSNQNPPEAWPLEQKQYQVWRLLGIKSRSSRTNSRTVQAGSTGWDTPPEVAGIHSLAGQDKLLEGAPHGLQLPDVSASWSQLAPSSFCEIWAA